MEQLPSIAGIEITTDEHGRFNLNAIHKASGLDENKYPAQWLRTQSTKDLIDELSANMHLAHEVISTQKGGSSPGTFAHEILAVEYAGWISPDFRITVNQTFIDYRKGALPALAPATTTLPSLVAEFKAGVELAEIFGFRDNQALLSANKAVEKLTGTNVMFLMGATYLRAPVQQETYIPTEIGKMLKDSVGPRTVNRLLENMGLQESYRNHRDDIKWRLLEKGEPYGELVDVDKASGGAPVKQIHWYATVVPLLQEHIEFEEE